MECEWVRFREFRHGNIAGAGGYVGARSDSAASEDGALYYVLGGSTETSLLINLCCRLIFVLYSCFIDHQMTGWVMARICM